MKPPDDLEAHLRGLGIPVHVEKTANGRRFIVLTPTTCLDDVLRLIALVEKRNGLRRLGDE